MTTVRRGAPLAWAAGLTLAAAAAACAGAPARRSTPEPLATARGAGERRVFEVGGRARLTLALPPGWTGIEEDGEGPLRTIRLERAGARLRALITPFWNPGEPETVQARADTAQLFAEIARRRALAGSVERELSLEELSGPQAHGYWFGATDRELSARKPGPGEWRHILQGAAAVGPLVLAFTLLDDGPGPQRDELLGIVRTAQAEPVRGEDEAGAAALRPRPELGTTPLRVAAAGKRWGVLLDLPGFRMASRGSGADESLIGVDPGTGVVASIALRAADDTVRDAHGCRDQAMARIRRAVGDDLARLRTSDAPPFARVDYDLSEVEGKPGLQRHAHTFLFRERTCVQVHVSAPEPEPEDAAQLEAILRSVRITEEL